jgi:hypothetical protein
LRALFARERLGTQPDALAPHDDALARDYRTFGVLVDAIRRYRPRPFTADALVIWSDDPVTDDRRRRWETVLTRAHTREVGGNHYSVLQRSSETVAAEIEAFLAPPRRLNRPDPAKEAQRCPDNSCSP